MAASTASDSMNHLSEQAGAPSMPASGQQVVNVTNIIGNQNYVKNDTNSLPLPRPQITSDSGSDSSRPASPNGQQKDDRHYVTTKTLTVVALCSTKAPIPVRLLLMIVDLAFDESVTYQISRMFLARCKIDTGKYEAAHNLMKDCLDSKAVKGLEGELGRPYLRGRMYFEMARTCEKLGKFDEAFLYCSKALEDDRREEGFRYPQYLMYAAYYKAMSTIEGNVSESDAVLDRALRDCSKADSILRKRHGEGHHHRAHVLCIEARIWQRYDPKEALRRAQRACDITVETYGYEHNKVAKMFDLLGDIFNAQGDKEKAFKAYWRAKNMYSEKDHSRAGNIEEKLSGMPVFNAPPSECTNSDLFEELLEE
ncbi:hypothetical protein Bbelb_213670 [Branchiostoma belcheri]|nr:hypothetical protein Bbelb_213670 [Branchiostoma belcheri]